MSNGDPIGADEPRGKSRAGRKGRYDGSYTGTEQRTKNRLMRQFMRTGEGPGGNSDAYRNASCWCACGKLILRDGLCAKCLYTVPLGQHPDSESVSYPGEHGTITVTSDPRVHDGTGSFVLLTGLTDAD